MNLKYMKVSLFEIRKNELFHDILIFLDVPVYNDFILDREIVFSFCGTNNARASYN